MFVCTNCGTLVEEVPTTTQCHGYSSLGQPFEETIDDCCSCGGEFVEAEKCSICGKWFDDADEYHVCECCMEEHETVKDAIELGEDDLVSVDGINGFVAKALSVEQINNILKRWVEENFVDRSKEVVKYCESDESRFADYLYENYGE